MSTGGEYHGCGVYGGEVYPGHRALDTNESHSGYWNAAVQVQHQRAEADKAATKYRGYW